MNYYDIHFVDETEIEFGQPDREHKDGPYCFDFYRAASEMKSVV